MWNLTGARHLLADVAAQPYTPPPCVVKCQLKDPPSAAVVWMFIIAGVILIAGAVGYAVRQQGRHAPDASASGGRGALGLGAFGVVLAIIGVLVGMSRSDELRYQDSLLHNAATGIIAQAWGWSEGGCGTSRGCSLRQSTDSGLFGLGPDFTATKAADYDATGHITVEDKRRSQFVCVTVPDIVVPSGPPYGDMPNLDGYVVPGPCAGS